MVGCTTVEICGSRWQSTVDRSRTAAEAVGVPAAGLVTVVAGPALDPTDVGQDRGPVADPDPGAATPGPSRGITGRVRGRRLRRERRNQDQNRLLGLKQDPDPDHNSCQDLDQDHYPTVS